MPYYVTQIRDGKFRRISQPFKDKEAAENAVDDCRKRVIENDAWSHFDSFGVAKWREDVGISS